jgi:hypothetical protein
MVLAKISRRECCVSERVDCLMLINTLVTAAGWFEWGYNKRNIRHMTQIGSTPVTNFISLKKNSLAKFCFWVGSFMPGYEMLYMGFTFCTWV